MQRKRVAWTSKLAMSVATGPAWWSSTAATCVGTTTSIQVPASCWLVICRRAREIRALPVTRRTGPSSETRAVT